MFIAAFADLACVNIGGFNGAVGKGAVFVPNFNAAAGQDGKVTFLKLCDFVGQGGQGNGV